VNKECVEEKLITADPTKYELELKEFVEKVYGKKVEGSPTLQGV